jgi:hypothetical protein
MEQSDKPITRANWLREQIRLSTQAVVWCLAEIRLHEENGEPVSLENWYRLDSLSGELHRRTRELCTLSEKTAGSEEARC